jgi:hypothetical protein
MDKSSTEQQNWNIPLHHQQRQIHGSSQAEGVTVARELILKDTVCSMLSGSVLLGLSSVRVKSKFRLFFEEQTKRAEFSHY